jgi:hypothetical protein
MVTKNSGMKRANPRHRKQVAASADRIERSMEKTERQAGRSLIADTLIDLFKGGRPETRYRQELVFLREWHVPGSVPKARPVPLAMCPDRVWTLFREEDETKPPVLPLLPLHGRTGFLEDKIHDWDWRPTSGGTFYFHSRIADRPVWVLLEYKEKP